MKTGHWIILALIILGLILIIGSIPGTGGSRTYAETAEVYKQECIREKGYGEWRGSSGVTLDNFCGLAGVVRARKEMCAEYPEDC